MPIKRLPLEELVLPDVQVALSRVRKLTTEDIRDLLRAGPVQFVVANVGDPLDWIPLADCYDFWKARVKPRVVETESWSLDDFPEGLAYIASLWGPAGRESIEETVVLLEASH